MPTRSDRPGEPRIIASAANQAEAELIRGRLLEGGIHSLARRSFGVVQMGDAGGRDVLVNEGDVERARALLKEDEGSFSDEELARLSEEAGREAREG